jgi:hypothetical protein
MGSNKKRRDRPVVSITLSPEGIAVLDELVLVRGSPSRSALLEFIIREEALRMRLDPFALGARERKKRGMPKIDRPSGSR